MTLRPAPVDVYVGQRLRTRRTLLGISESSLADSVNLTFQQIQKYERRANRMAVSRLLQFSKILDVPISYFFDDLPETCEIVINNNVVTPDGPDVDYPPTQETLVLVRVYRKVKDPSLRKCAIDLLRSLAARTTD